MSTKIPWVINPDGKPGQVLNVATGCTPISAGCANCYARRLACGRLRGRFGFPQEDPFQVVIHPERLQIPFNKKKQTTYFVCSMGDLFHQDVTESYIIDVFEMMIENPRHIFIVLTKRPERMRNILHRNKTQINVAAWPHIWLGVSVENQDRARYRLPLLSATPAANRFVSIEPMLGPLDIRFFLPAPSPIRWVIAGGENGPGARPMHPNWIREIRDQCLSKSVPFFFKGWGEWVPQQQNPAALTRRSAANALYIDPVSGKTRDAKFGTRGNSATVQRVGSKASGHLIDGQEYRLLPWAEIPRNQTPPEALR